MNLITLQDLVILIPSYHGATDAEIEGEVTTMGTLLCNICKGRAGLTFILLISLHFGSTRSKMNSSLLELFHGIDYWSPPVLYIY